MAIQIGSTTVIDDSRNILNVNDVRVGVVTISASTGNIETSGTITAGGIDTPLDVIYFSPIDGSTGQDRTQNITISFDQQIQAGTGTIYLRTDSPGGTGIGTFNIQSSPNVSIVNGTTLSINPTKNFPSNKTIFLVIGSGVIKGTGISSFPFSGINTSTSGIAYSFTTNTTLVPGDTFQNSIIICQSGGTRWLIPPAAAEVSRCYNLINDSVTRAQAVTGYSGWFCPSYSKLQNPGYTCRDFWDSYGPTYWSYSPVACIPTPGSSGYAAALDFNTGAGIRSLRPSIRCVRAFRCVSY